MPRALISVSNKRGIVSLADALADIGWELIASGGTSQKLEAYGIKVTPVTALTQTPEMLGGRVKTLHPALHAAILAREEDLDELNQHGFLPIDMVICNLYPFAETAAKKDPKSPEIIENIDIGGVSLLRAAAKNWQRVAAICDPQDYPAILEELRDNPSLSVSTRQYLAAKAFAHTRDYDSAIAAHFETHVSPASVDQRREATLPQRIHIDLSLAQKLRYGENPHQSAALYQYSDDNGSSTQENQLLGGKALSYNNLLDLDAAWRAVCSFERPTVVIVKHRTPTGIASNESIAAAFPTALASDPVSAFGGVIACNREIDQKTVDSLGKLFIEVLAAPAFSAEALVFLRQTRPNCRLMSMAQDHRGDRLEFRSIHGGLLAQQTDAKVAPLKWECVTRQEPTHLEEKALHFAWRAVQHIPSNAIVLAQLSATVGIGGGLPSRVDSVHLACHKAGQRTEGAVLSSDAFFPFADGIEAAAQAGVTAVVQPGGSIRDPEVIEAANQAGLAMIFTGRRHFRH